VVAVLLAGGIGVYLMRFELPDGLVPGGCPICRGTDPVARADADISKAAREARSALCLVHLQMAMARWDSPLESGVVRLAADQRVDALKTHVPDSIRAHGIGSTASSHVHNGVWRDALDWSVGTASGQHASQN
jgi:hypothetical protein